MPEKIHHTSFGDIFISYYPMHKGEEIVGILGIEFSAGGQYTTYRKMAIAAPVIIGLFCIMAAVIAVVLFRRILNPAYHDMANTDFLTGLKNRNAFEVDLNNLECTRQKSGICLVSVDLDNLKTVNDTMGDAAGDSYIKACTKILKDNLDSAGTLYRTGGDEFIMILEDTDEEKAAAMMERIYEDCRGCTGLKNVAVSLSAGYAFYEEPDDTLEDTFRRADEKMYECKKKKR